MVKKRKQGKFLSAAEFAQLQQMSVTKVKRLVRAGKIEGAEKVSAPTPTGYKYLIPAPQAARAQEALSGDTIAPIRQRVDVKDGESTRDEAWLYTSLNRVRQVHKRLALVRQTSASANKEVASLHEELDLQLGALEAVALRVRDNAK